AHVPTAGSGRGSRGARAQGRPRAGADQAPVASRAGLVGPARYRGLPARGTGAARVAPVPADDVVGEPAGLGTRGARGQRPSHGGGRLVCGLVGEVRLAGDPSGPGSLSAGADQGPLALAPAAEGVLGGTGADRALRRLAPRPGGGGAGGDRSGSR